MVIYLAESSPTPSSAQADNGNLKTAVIGFGAALGVCLLLTLIMSFVAVVFIW